MSFGSTLRGLRQNRGIGIKGLARDLGVNYTYVSKMENDKGIPSTDTVQRIAAYFNYDEDELMLSAGRVPPEVLRILRSNPQEALAYLRRRFGHVHQ